MKISSRLHLSTTCIILTILGSLSAVAAGGANKIVTVNYPDGQVQSQYWVTPDNIKEGPCREYYPDGQFKAHMIYKVGKLSGEYRLYYSLKDYRPTSRPATAAPAPLSKKDLKVLATYQNGLLNGKYTEYDPAGQIVKQSQYVQGKLNGPVAEYKDGKLIREQVFLDDEVLYPRGIQLLTAELAAIDKLPVMVEPGSGEEGAKPVPASPEEAKALRTLMKYRFLCNVPYRHLTLTKEYNLQAQAAAEINQVNGPLSHTPRNPDWPEDKYKFAADAAAKCNLGFSNPPSKLDQSVHSWMDDSDQQNIDRVGHRRWCLNPPMSKTGFGSVGCYSAMVAMDCSRNPVPDWDFVAFPAQGLFPLNFFGPRFAWSVSLNQDKYSVPDVAGVKVKVYRHDPSRPGKDATASNEINVAYLNVESGGFGSGLCVIFRPDFLSAGDFQKGLVPAFRVEITGLVRDAKPVTISYYVKFVNLAQPAGAQAPGKR